MTNLIEKSLLTGFGIFVLITFFSIITPFINTIINFNEEQRENLNIYTSFIDEIDIAVNFVIDNPENHYIKSINYPSNINLTVINNYVKFYYSIDSEIYSKIIEYSILFKQKSFNNLAPKIYLLNVSNGPLIDISLN